MTELMEILQRKIDHIYRVCPEGNLFDPNSDCETIAEHTEFCHPWVATCDRHWDIKFPASWEPNWTRLGYPLHAEYISIRLWQRMLYEFEERDSEVVKDDISISSVVLDHAKHGHIASMKHLGWIIPVGDGIPTGSNIPYREAAQSSSQEEEDWYEQL